jgi:transposase-like protein
MNASSWPNSPSTSVASVLSFRLVMVCFPLIRIGDVKHHPHTMTTRLITFAERSAHYSHPVKASGQRRLITIVGHAAAIGAGGLVQMSSRRINDRTQGLQFHPNFLRRCQNWLGNLNRGLKVKSARVRHDKRGNFLTRRLRRNPRPLFKANVAVVAIKGEKTLIERAQQFDVHAKQITQWRAPLLKGVLSLFGNAAKAEAAVAYSEQNITSRSPQPVQTNRAASRDVAGGVDAGVAGTPLPGAPGLPC